MEKQLNPDELLSYVTQEEEKAKRGKLKVFFGAAPGVGKTYTMLQDALQKHAEGMDVMVGIVESHGRVETQQLLDQLPCLPRKSIEYHGNILSEFDLDAAISRHPGILLVDELAHTNAPGCRHEKRWQDVKELIERGIDVYTALNVQHVESLNDVVAQITGVRVRETVPDSMLELIDSIELVDLSPEDLLQRLNEGKIYIPEQAKLATDKFFRKSNLVALRELALRVTAEKVNTELLMERRGQADNVWPTTERLLVCVGPGARAAKLIRSARRLAVKLQAEWLAVYVKSPQKKVSEKLEKSALDNLRLAETLGAETIILNDDDFVKGIINCARSRNVSKVVVEKRIRSRWKDLLFGSLVDELMRQSSELDIYVIQNSQVKDPDDRSSNFLPSFDFNFQSPFKAYIIALLYVLVGTALNFIFCNIISNSNLIMIYLLSIILVALRGQRGPSIFASCLSVIFYDFCFVPPRFSFAVTDSEYLITLLVMLVVTQIISHLTIINKEKTQAVQQQQLRTMQLLGLSRQLAENRGTIALLNHAIQYLGEIFHAQMVVLLPDEHQQLKPIIVFGGKQELDDKQHSIAQWSYDLKQRAGLGTQTLSSNEFLYIPLMAREKVLGILCLKPENKKQFLQPENMHSLESSINQIALSLEVDIYADSVMPIHSPSLPTKHCNSGEQRN